MTVSWRVFCSHTPTGAQQGAAGLLELSSLLSTRTKEATNAFHRPLTAFNRFQWAASDPALQHIYPSFFVDRQVYFYLKVL